MEPVTKKIQLATATTKSKQTQLFVKPPTIKAKNVIYSPNNKTNTTTSVIPTIPNQTLAQSSPKALKLTGQSSSGRTIQLANKQSQLNSNFETSATALSSQQNNSNDQNPNKSSPSRIQNKQNEIQKPSRQKQNEIRNAPNSNPNSNSNSNSSAEQIQQQFLPTNQQQSSQMQPIETQNQNQNRQYQKMANKGGMGGNIMSTGQQYGANSNNLNTKQQNLSNSTSTNQPHFHHATNSVDLQVLSAIPAKNALTTRATLQGFRSTAGRNSISRAPGGLTSLPPHHNGAQMQGGTAIFTKTSDLKQVVVVQAAGSKRNRGNLSLNIPGPSHHNLPSNSTAQQPIVLSSRGGSSYRQIVSPVAAQQGVHTPMMMNSYTTRTHTHTHTNELSPKQVRYKGVSGNNQSRGSVGGFTMQNVPTNHSNIAGGFNSNGGHHHQSKLAAHLHHPHHPTLPSNKFAKQASLNFDRSKKFTVPLPSKAASLTTKHSFEDMDDETLRRQLQTMARNQKGKFERNAATALPTQIRSQPNATTTTSNDPKSNTFHLNLSTQETTRMNTTTTQMPSSQSRFKNGSGDPHVFIPGFLGGAGSLRSPSSSINNQNQNQETTSISLTNKLKSSSVVRQQFPASPASTQSNHHPQTQFQRQDSTNHESAAQNQSAEQNNTTTLTIDLGGGINGGSSIHQQQQERTGGGSLGVKNKKFMLNNQYQQPTSQFQQDKKLDIVAEDLLRSPPLPQPQPSSNLVSKRTVTTANALSSISSSSQAQAAAVNTINEVFRQKGKRKELVDSELEKVSHKNNIISNKHTTTKAQIYNNLRQEKPLTSSPAATRNHNQTNTSPTNTNTSPSKGVAPLVKKLGQQLQSNPPSGAHAHATGAISELSNHDKQSTPHVPQQRQVGGAGRNSPTNFTTQGSNSPQRQHEKLFNHSGINFEKILDRPISSAQQPLNLQSIRLPNFDQTRLSEKENGVVKAFAANTNQGIIRDYNEDRVSIVLNMSKPAEKYCERWPKCSFFAIFDGHGGYNCADFLRDNLHTSIIKDAEFPQNPRQAIINGFKASEAYFLDTVEKYSAGKQTRLDRSGSCAIVTLFVDDLCFVANVGDSRAILSGAGGQYTVNLSYDHKPNDQSEQARIQAAGGKIYQTQQMTRVPDQSGRPGLMRDQIIYGPHRVFPGRLSVSRTFGDIEAKRVKYGGNPRVVIATPEIKCFKIEENYDYIVLGCDGIFDKLNNVDVIQAAWEASKRTFTERTQSVHTNCGHAVEAILKASVAERTLDNITVVVIAFKNFRKNLKAEVDKFNNDLKKQITQLEQGLSLQDIAQRNAEEVRLAETSDNKRAGEDQIASGLQISKSLNLPNYDLSLADVEIQPKLVSLARLQKLTTGSHQQNIAAFNHHSQVVQRAMLAQNNNQPQSHMMALNNKGHHHHYGGSANNGAGFGGQNSSKYRQNQGNNFFKNTSNSVSVSSAAANSHNYQLNSSDDNGSLQEQLTAISSSGQDNQNSMIGENGQKNQPAQRQLVMTKRRGTTGSLQYGSSNTHSSSVNSGRTPQNNGMSSRFGQQTMRGMRGEANHQQQSSSSPSPPPLVNSHPTTTKAQKQTYMQQSGTMFHPSSSPANNGKIDHKIGKSLRATLVTPRGANQESSAANATSGSVVDEQSMVQHQRYTSIVSQSRARRNPTTSFRNNNDTGNLNNTL